MNKPLSEGTFGVQIIKYFQENNLGTPVDAVYLTGHDSSADYHITFDDGTSADYEIVFASAHSLTISGVHVTF